MKDCFSKFEDMPIMLSANQLAIFLGISRAHAYTLMHSKQALEEIEGVRVLTPHSCRHTYVSQMQALGVAIETIQSLVGHADIDMTKHYLHVQEPIRQEAIERFDQAFSNRHGGVFGNVLQYTKTS